MKRFRELVSWSRLGKSPWALKSLKRPVAVMAIVILLLTMGTVWLFTVGAIDSKAHWFDETAVPNGVGICHYLGNGDRIILIDGTFDGATVSLQTAVRNSTGNTPCASADRMIDVNVPALVGITAESVFVPMQTGAGFYRLLVVGGAGSESINMHVREVE